MNEILKKLKRETEKELLKLREEEIISPAIIKEYQNIEILFVEDILDVVLPESFRTFLFLKKKSFINKQEILGLPTGKKTTSILEATKLLRIKRPDLLPHLIVVSLTNNSALCLDILNGNQLDAPIAEVSFKKNTPPVLFSESFKDFIKTGKKTSKSKEIKNLMIVAKGRIRIIR